MRITLKDRIAIAVCKLLRLISRILRKGGTAMPGRIAMKISPDLLSRLASEVKTIAITGTNGKTTCARMIEQAFAEAGLIHFSNRAGANLMSGITTEFVMNCSLSGKMKKTNAVIECDEQAAAKVFKQLQPAVIVVTNLFRDQLDRYGEITHTLASIRTGIMDVPHAVLCLNADCSLTSSIAKEHISNQIVWYGINKSADLKSVPAIMSDASHCIFCKAEYQYDYHTYAHLGGFRCPKCGYVRHDPDFAVTEIECMDEQHSEVILHSPDGNHHLTINLPAGYNLYNAAASVCAAVTFGIASQICINALGNFSCGFGRMESFPLAGGTRMILVKNPTGCSQALEYLSNIRNDFILAVCLNDRAADGTDISWIWDANFELLNTLGEKIKKIYVSGCRAEDLRLRLKYASLPLDRIVVESDPDNLTNLLSKETLPIYIMPTYTAMLDLRTSIVHRCGGAEFWEQ